MSEKVASLFVVASLLLLLASWFYFSPSPEGFDEADSATTEDSAVVEDSARPLLPGDPLPPIEVVRWIQGNPVDFERLPTRVTVIDVWSNW